jgi:peptidoglycan hydrolase-like protein with peptidoglycan-binding domain
VADDVDNKKNQGKGFAGLSSLVSDIDVPTPSEPVKTQPQSEPRPTAAETAPPSPPPRPRPQPAPTSSTQPTSGSSPRKWVLGAAALIGLFWLIGQANKNPSSPSPTYTPSAATQAPYSAPPPVAQPQVPSRPSEEAPPVGQGHSLSIPQIRYCLAEDIRLDGARGAVNNYNDSHVDRFNAMVADYNSRCSNFRYRRGALESARQDIEPYRNDLQSEGRNRFGGASKSQRQQSKNTARESQPSFGTLDPQTTRSEPSPTVLAIQKKLNQLGYDAGIADGLAGAGTRAAIVAFQRDKGLSQDGLATSNLLELLERQTSRPSGSSSAITPTPPSPAPAVPLAPPPAPGVASPKPGIPANAFVSGANWYCKEGFKRNGDQCDAVIAPQNAFVSGANWYCKEGFKRVGDQCDAVIAPQNAFISGANWYCKEGFRRIGDQCEAVIAPQNAFISGANWYCRDGFKRVGNQCDAVIAPPNAFVSGASWYCKDGFKKAGERCISVSE